MAEAQLEAIVAFAVLTWVMVGNVTATLGAAGNFAKNPWLTVLLAIMPGSSMGRA